MGKKKKNRKREAENVDTEPKRSHSQRHREVRRLPFEYSMRKRLFKFFFKSIKFSIHHNSKFCILKKKKYIYIYI